MLWGRGTVGSQADRSFEAEGGTAMHFADATGYLASGLVLAAFGMKDMVKLRLVAICSNVVFLVYGLSLGLAPVWLLHAVLLPLNLWRLAQVLGGGDGMSAARQGLRRMAAGLRRARPRDLPPARALA